MTAGSRACFGARAAAGGGGFRRAWCPGNGKWRSVRRYASEMHLDAVEDAVFLVCGFQGALLESGLERWLAEIISPSYIRGYFTSNCLHLKHLNRLLTRATSS